MKILRITLVETIDTSSVRPIEVELRVVTDRGSAEYWLSEKWTGRFRALMVSDHQVGAVGAPGSFLEHHYLGSRIWRAPTESKKRAVEALFLKLRLKKAINLFSFLVILAAIVFLAVR